MRVTQVCLRQHIGRMFKRHWIVQGRKVPLETGAMAEMEKLNINVQDAMEYVYGKPKTIEPVKEDKSGVKVFPRKSNLNCSSEFLIEGLNQASNMTRTIVVDSLPKNIVNLIETIKIPKAVHETVKRTITRDQLFEFRPFKVAANPMLLPNLVSCCDQIAGPKASSHKKVANNAYFGVPVKKNNQIVRLETTIDHLVLSDSPTDPCPKPDGLEMSQVADIYPLSFDASLFKHTEEMELIYPIKTGPSSRWQPQIIVQKSEPHELSYHETPVTDNHIRSRALMSSFVVAAAKAINEFGVTVKRLPKPVVIQSVLRTGNRFHFGVFQLNTLNLDDSENSDESSGATNYWYQSPTPLDLYAIDGDQSLHNFQLVGYNENVVRYLAAFYLANHHHHQQKQS